ncbi:hypothetical protein [Streptomyces sp. Root1310]|jgi:hypothetical protein|uniref:hypothetical protein n=1 Tax=Streptomyces sp. Root1310 TaxID=1736452 RepID=UPI00070A995D|nr:hypothetical protein [Streptomyces sp. Root1310]KQX71156.1 hypothetical protein ASD48_12205 [Streptomyces sp. Root1310]
MGERPIPDASADGHWILEDNLRPFCESVARFSGYRFDDSDWQAIETALPATDVDRPDGWYDYPLSGRVPLILLVAADPEASVVFVRLTGAPDARTRAQIEAALYIFSTYQAG